MMRYHPPRDFAKDCVPFLEVDPRTVKIKCCVLSEQQLRASAIGTAKGRATILRRSLAKQAELYAKQPQDAQMTEERSEDKALLDDELLEVITDSPEQLIENACINRMSA